MNVTSRSRYALKIMMDLAYREDEALVKRHDIAERQGIPSKYLDQIMVFLRRGGLVDSVRGRDGGYVLAKRSSEISVWEIFAAVEEGIYPVLCVGENGCFHESECMTRDPWQLIFGKIKGNLEALSLGELVHHFPESRKTGLGTGVRECLQGRGMISSVN